MAMPQQWFVSSQIGYTSSRQDELMGLYQRRIERTWPLLEAAGLFREPVGGLLAVLFEVMGWLHQDLLRQSLIGEDLASRQDSWDWFVAAGWSAHVYVTNHLDASEADPEPHPTLGE